MFPVFTGSPYTLASGLRKALRAAVSMLRGLDIIACDTAL
jgi:hypothetical protein